MWYVAGDQQEGPLPSPCCCGRRCRRKGAPSMEEPPVKEQDCSLHGEATREGTGVVGSLETKSKMATKKNRRGWRNAATIASQA